MPVVRVDLEVNTRDGSYKIQQTTGTIKDLGREAKATEGALKAMMAGVGAGVGIKALQEVLGFLKMVGAELLEFGKRGSTVAAVHRSFEQLAAGARQSGREILASTREASKGLVSNFDIMAAANKAFLLGLPVTAQNMATMARASIVLGQAMQVGPEKALQDLITGLGRGSALILDNIGITVNAEEAYKKYADALGKKANALTEAEKKLAIYNAAMAAAAKATETVGGIQMRAAESALRMQVAVDNAADSFAEAMASSTGLNDLLSDLADTMDGLGSGVEGNKAKVTAFFDELAVVVRATADALNDIDTHVIDNLVKLMNPYQRAYTGGPGQGDFSRLLSGAGGLGGLAGGAMTYGLNMFTGLGSASATFGRAVLSRAERVQVDNEADEVLRRLNALDQKPPTPGGGRDPVAVEKLAAAWREADEDLKAYLRTAGRGITYGAGMYGTGKLPGEGTADPTGPGDDILAGIAYAEGVAENDRLSAKGRENAAAYWATTVKRARTDTEKMEEAVYQVERAWRAASAALSIYAAGTQATSRWQAVGQGMETGAAAGSMFGPFGTAFGLIGGAVAGQAGWNAGEDDRIRGQFLEQINGHVAAAEKALEAIERLRTRTREVVVEGAEGLAAMFERASTPEDFERLGRLALAGVEAMRAQGFSMLEIFRALGPALDAAAAAMERLGVDNAGQAKGGMTMRGAFGELMHLRELIEANEDLIASVEGTNAVIRMLSETGKLTGENLTDVLAQAAQDYEALRAAGFTHIEALMMQADTLRILNRLQQEGKITLDETTQARINDAAAAGLLDPTPQEAMKAALDLQLLVLVGIAQMFGVVLPQRVQEYIDALNRIPTPGGVPGGGGGGIDPNEGGGKPQPQETDLLTSARGFGPRLLARDTVFYAHAGEHVLIVPKGIGFASAEEGFGSGSFKTPIGSDDPTPWKQPAGGGGSGGAPWKDYYEGGSSTAPASSTQLAELTAAVQSIASRPSVNVQSNPTIVVEDKSLVKNRDGQEAFARMVLPVVDRALRLNTDGLASRVKQIVKEED